MKTAIYEKNISPMQKVYRASDGGYLMVSAVDSAFDTGRPETMVFRSDSDGKPTNWGDIGVVYSVDHDAALLDAGYEAVYNVIDVESTEIRGEL